MLQLCAAHALQVNSSMLQSLLSLHLNLVGAQLAVAISNYGCETIRPVLVGKARSPVREPKLALMCELSCRPA